MNDKTIQELKDLIKNTSPRGVKVSVRSKEKYVDLLNYMYPELDISEQIYLFSTGLTNIPLAPCGNNAKFESVNKGYKYHCEKSVFGKDKCPACSNAMNNKKMETNISLYGVNNPSKNPETILKAKKTNMKKYGNEICQQTDIVKNKAANTHRKLYIDGHSSRTEHVKNKTKNTVKKKYGVKSSLLLNQKTLQERFDIFKNKNEPMYTLLSSIEEYDIGNVKSIFKWKCNKCNNVFSRVEPCLRCTTCFPYNNSVPENELCEFLDSIGIHYEKNNRTMIKPYEIDILIPSHNIAIEYNGDYWHSTNIRPDSKYHQNKTLKMKELGYKLITIFDSEYKNKPDIIKKRLKNLLKINPIKIYARKCEIKEVSYQDSVEFLNKHHIQGSCVSSIRIGLYYNSELKLLMTFGKSRFDKTVQYELLRLCSDGIVTGGASKVLKYFEIKYKPTSLISYADMKWSSGEIYEKLNFLLVRVTKPGYFYSNKTTTLTRYECKKKDIIIKYNITNINLTEEEIMKEQGYYKIFDCGNMVFKKTY